MIKHYLKTAFHNILKHKTQSVVSILGITAGILCFSVCTYYVRATYRGDSEFPRFKEMVTLRVLDPNDATYRPVYDPDVQNRFMELFSEDMELVAGMEYSTRRYNIDLKHHGTERKVRVTSKECNGDFVLVYPPKLMMGSLEEFRKYPNSVIITEELSKKLFGDESPLGKTLHVESVTYYNPNTLPTFTITGVMKPYLPFVLNDFSLFNILHHYDVQDGYDGYDYTYILKPEANIRNLNDRLSKIGFEKEAKPTLFYTRELREINPAAFFVSLIGLFVLLAGLLNYLNITIGTFVNRTGELGLRKVLGALRYQQFFLLFAELLVILSVSFLLCIALTETLIPYLMSTMPADFTRELPLSLNELLRHQSMYFLCILVLCSLIALIGIFRINEKQKTSRHRVRNILLGVQFSICMLFVLATGATYFVSKNTLKIKAPYLNETEMEHILFIDLHRERSISEKHIPEITQYIRSSSLFDTFAFVRDRSSRVENYKNEPASSEIAIKYVPSEYLEIMKFPLTRPLNNGEPCCFINEALNEKLKKDSLDYIQIDGIIYPVAQVVNSIETGWSYLKEIAYIPVTNVHNPSHIYIRSQEGKPKEAFAALQAEIQSYLPEYNDFEIKSLREHHLSSGQDILQALFAICSVICILITILGLYGAIAIDTERKQKEVAIRKINGAGIKQIYWMFGKSYLRLFLIAAIIICVAGLFVLNLLSSNLKIFFNYTNPFYWIFSFLMVAIVIICTIVYRIHVIARINPADIIKTE